MSAVQDFFKGIRIYDVPYTKVRLGKPSDGGYVCLDEINQRANVLYTYGVGTEISFEEDFSSRYPRCAVRMFDHTINSLPPTGANLHFVKEGLGVAPNTGSPLDTIENHLYRFGDLNKPHKILKIDIEWNEWSFFECVDFYTLKDFDQILCEFHTIPVLYKDSHTPYFEEFHRGVYREVNETLFSRYNHIMEKVLLWFAPYHVHINNSLPLVDVNGYKIPSLVELSLVNRSLVDCDNLVESTASFPIAGLDYPNKPYRADVTDFKWNP